MFRHDLIELPTIQRIDGQLRYYEVPTGEKYPSVTTVLDKTSDKSNLIAWRKRVGNEEADRIQKKATSRGTQIHNQLENFVLNKPVSLTENFSTINMYKQIESFLQENVDDIRSAEGQLFSHKLRVAGSCDLIASYNGKPAIIDYKTSVRNKQKVWIENYFLQAAMYSYMLYEMTKLYHPTIVVAIAIEEELKPQIFVEHVSNYIDKARERCAMFHALKAENVF